MSRARTDREGEQIELTPCAWAGCGVLFAPRYPGQRFHSGPCRAAYSREVGITGTLTGSRRMKRAVKISFTTDNEAVLDAPLGARFRLVREP